MAKPCGCGGKSNNQPNPEAQKIREARLAARQAERERVAAIANSK